MNTEISEIMAKPGRVTEWAEKVKYNTVLSEEEKDISEVMDHWAHEVGKTGCDSTHEISQLINKSITPDTVTAPSELIDMLFDQSSIGEFDDKRTEQTPENTIKVYDASVGGNVDRSFIDHKIFKPVWSNLQAETDLRLIDMRKGGYKSVANLITYITEALELQKYAHVMTVIDNAVVSGTGNYISESTAAPTEASVDALNLWLMDMANGDVPQLFAMNKYIQKVASFTKAYQYATDASKNQFNTKGFLDMYGGSKLTGVSGERKLATGGFIIPDKKLFGAVGKIGELITRGETITLQETDINKEQIHIKVGGYSFGTMLTNPKRVGKIVMAK